MNRIRLIIPLVIAIAFFCLGIYVYAYHRGQYQTYEDIVLEKCWLNKQSRDIECIQYISE